MGKKAKKKKPVANVVVPRAGPPTNIRPGGFHADRRREKRVEIKAELRRIEPEDPGTD
jgi:hypothetical protein